MRRALVPAAALVAALMISGCARGPGRAPDADRRCAVPEKLPGASRIADDIRARLEAAFVPVESLHPARVTCNRLALEASTFARQHATDAVDWRPWSPAVLEEAGALDRPVLVLTGFATSAGGSPFSRKLFGRRRLAKEINSHFVPVLVDRHERPDVDAYLMNATEVLTGGGGWPALVFVEAGGRPFSAYSWGAAGAGNKTFAKVIEEALRHIALGGTPAEKAEATIEKMQRRADIDSSGPYPDAKETAASLAGYLAASYDSAAGTFGPPPLFPRAPVLAFLATQPEPALRDMLATVWARLAASPLADRDGGFFRYAREPRWQAPVAEKMLADNAALVLAALDAAEASGAAGRDDLRKECAGIARTTLEFVRRDLGLPGGGFAASISRATCDHCRPVRDDAMLADANALAASAFARAAVVLADASDRETAAAAAEAIEKHLVEGARVRHCVYPGGRACADGYLADHALVAQAFLDLERMTGDARWLERARAVADGIAGRFGHAAGGDFQTASDGEQLPLRLKPVLDTAFPSGNSAAALVYARLAARTRDGRYAERCRRSLEAFADVLTLRPLAAPSLVVALAECRGVQASAPPQLDPAPAVQP